MVGVLIVVVGLALFQGHRLLTGNELEAALQEQRFRADAEFARALKNESRSSLVSIFLPVALGVGGYFLVDYLLKTWDALFSKDLWRSATFAE